MDDAKRITITICGDGGCGKSSITLRLVRSQWNHEYDPTIEDAYTLTRRIDGQNYYLSITDTAGQEEYRGMWASSNLHSDAFLLVYDITSQTSLEQLDYFNDLIDIASETSMDTWMIKQNHSARSHGTSKSWVRPVKIVAGNKCDLQESREVPARQGLEWARKRGCGFMETSARNTVNIEETFALLVRRVMEARRQADGADSSDREAQFGLGQLASGQNFVGTRRAVTAPLSPLPLPGEKHMTFRPGGSSSALRAFFRRLRCWS